MRVLCEGPRRDAFWAALCEVSGSVVRTSLIGLMMVVVGIASNSDG